MKTFLFYLTKPQSQVCILNIQTGFFAWVSEPAQAFLLCLNYFDQHEQMKGPLL